MSESVSSRSRHDGTLVRQWKTYIKSGQAARRGTGETVAGNRGRLQGGARWKMRACARRNRETTA